VENGANLAWACEHCQKKSYQDLHDYTKKMLNTYGLQQGGYPFRADDLTLTEWCDLGRLAKILNPNRGCPAMMMAAPQPNTSTE